MEIPECFWLDCLKALRTAAGAGGEKLSWIAARSYGVRWNDLFSTLRNW